MTRRLCITMAVSSGLMAGCAGMGGENLYPPTAFRLSSPTYPAFGVMARKHAGNDKSNPNCIGDNVSPALSWSNAPARTRSFAMLVDDFAGGSGAGVSHWVAYGIPVNVTSFAEAEVSALSPKFVGGIGSRKLAFYSGPCTPKGIGPHHYVFTLIATDLEPATLKPGLQRQELLAAIKGHNLAAADLVLRFVNP